MGLLPLPKLGDIDVAKTIGEFLGLLREMNTKLDTLIELQRGEGGGCVECDLKGRLHCRLHGPVRVPAVGEELDDLPLDEQIRNRS
jgi:hypothetical protein